MNSAPSPNFSSPRSPSVEPVPQNKFSSLDGVIGPTIPLEVSRPTFEAKPRVYAIGRNQQTYLDFREAPIARKIENLHQVLQEHLVSDGNQDQKLVEIEAKQPKKPIISEGVIEGVLDNTEHAGKFVKKQSLDIFSAIGDLLLNYIGFKHLTKEQEEQKKQQEMKEKEQNANKKSFYDAIINASVTLENTMMKLISELQERLGLGGKSLAEKNVLLGVKARNLSYSGLNTPYHIQAMHDALIEQERQQKVEQSKASLQSTKKGKTDYFMDKNSAISRQGQSVYSAAG